MKPSPLLIAAGLALGFAAPGFAASSGPRFYGDPPDDHHPWAVHDGNRPQPKTVVPGTFSSAEQPGRPPSDAVVLFDGTDLSKWRTDKGQPAPWRIVGGCLEVEPGTGKILTKELIGDCQLHIEWAAPRKVEGSSQGRGNSGIFLMDRLEIQVLDSYQNVTYADGHAGAYYGINPPMALPVRPPGEFQVCDIVFRRPIYQGRLVMDPGYVTVFINGVLVQDHTPLEGPGGHRQRTKAGPFPAKGPISLQDHGNPTRFRNIWYRELPPRPAEGGTDGYLTTEAALAKRQEIAAAIRQDAATLRNPADPLPQMLQLMESLVYQTDPAALEQASQMALAHAKSIEALPPAQLAPKKDQVKNLSDTYAYLIKFKILPADFAPQSILERIIRAQGWDKKPK